MALLDNEGPGGEYAAPAREKKKLSRARKALIGLLVVGAVGAVAGGGTFASFTASTDNRSADDPFEASNDMVLGNTVQSGTNTQCRSDSAGGGFTEEQFDPEVSDAVRCDVLFTAGDVATLAAGNSIDSEVILENLSGESKTGTLRWAAVDEDYAGCVGVDPGVSATDTSDDIFVGSTATDYSDYLCDNILVTIQEFAASGDRDTNVARTTNFASLTELAADADGGTRCTFPRESTLCEDADDADKRASLLPSSFDLTNSIIDNDFEPTNVANNEGLRFFRITARLVGDDLGCVGEVSTSTGIGCSNGADGTARFTVRWVLEEA